MYYAFTFIGIHGYDFLDTDYAEGQIQIGKKVFDADILDGDIYEDVEVDDYSFMFGYDDSLGWCLGRLLLRNNEKEIGEFSGEQLEQVFAQVHDLFDWLRIVESPKLYTSLLD